MADDIALSIEHLSKDFLLPHERKNSIREWVVHFRKPSFERLHVLHDLDFQVKRGEFFGIVGRNGSGKSTMLKIIGGIYQPTKGLVRVNGSLTPFIELGIGFNPELSGRENVYLNGAILGLTRKELNKKYHEIVEFAELEKFMDQKLKNYSSGMQVRLAFSIAIQAHNDILLIDEVLAVGDANFQKKCFDVFKQIKKSGKTVIFVTHDMGAVQDFCDRAMLISEGKIAKIGKSGEVARAYNELNLQDMEQKKYGRTRETEDKSERAIEILSSYTQLNGEKKRIFRPNEMSEIVVEYKTNQPVEEPIVGITIKDLTGRPLIVTNTKAKKMKIGKLKANEKYKAVFSVKNVLNDGTYTVSPAIASEDAKVFFDWAEDACQFDVAGWDFPAGLVQPEHSISIKNNGGKK